MAPLRVSITKSEWLPDDLTAFVPLRLWKSPFITTWDGSQNQNHPTDSADQGFFRRFSPKVSLVCFSKCRSHDLVRRFMANFGMQSEGPLSLWSQSTSGK